MSGEQEQYLSRRWRRGTLREVVLCDDKVVKRFWVRAGARRQPRPWVREHEALSRLAGPGVPRTYGYHEDNGADGRHVVYRRDYLPGEPLGRIDVDTAAMVGVCLAGIHAKGVVIADAARDNFVRVSGDRVACIDFGRARVFTWRSPRFYYEAGKEFAKLERETLEENSRLLQVCLRAYDEACPAAAWCRAFVRLGYAVGSTARRLRKGLWPALDPEWPNRRRMRFKRFRGGRLLVRPCEPESVRIEEYISRQEFLSVPEDAQLETHNKRFRVCNLRISGIPEKRFMMKMSRVNPAYPPLRRANVWFSEAFGDAGWRALRGAVALEKAGVATLRALACWRYRRGWHAPRSYLLYERIPASFSIRDYRLAVAAGKPWARQATLNRLVDAMADILAGMLRQGLRHDDVASGNFLVRLRGDEPDVWLIDTDHVSRIRWSSPFMTRFFTLRSLRRLDLKGNDLDRFLSRYLGGDDGPFWRGVYRFWHKGLYKPRKLLQRVAAPST